VRRDFVVRGDPSLVELPGVGQSFPGWWESQSRSKLPKHDSPKPLACGRRQGVGPAIRPSQVNNCWSKSAINSGPLSVRNVHRQRLAAQGAFQFVKLALEQQPNGF
jgi:hypothetical protein